jgi:hypothetical protein
MKEAATLRTPDEMTDLLSGLWSTGITHVAFDPDPGIDLNLVPIAVAIIGFQVDG